MDGVVTSLRQPRLVLFDSERFSGMIAYLSNLDVLDKHPKLFRLDLCNAYLSYIHS